MVSGSRHGRWPFIWLCCTSVGPLLIISQFAPKGVFSLSPILIALLVEIGKAIVSYCLPQSPSEPATLPARPSDDDDDPSISLSRKETPSEYVLAQLGGLSLLSTITTLMFFGAVSLAPASTLSLAQTFSHIASIFIDALYFQQSISGQQWLLISVHLAGFLASQWHDCIHTFLAPFWLYALLLSLVFLQQVAYLWHKTLLQHANSSAQSINMMLAMFSIPLLLWSWFSLPSDIFSLAAPSVSSSIGFSRIFGVCCIAVTLLASQLINAAVLHLPPPPSLLNLVPVVSTWLLFFFEYLSGLAYVTVNVLVGLCTVTLAVVSMNALSFPGSSGGEDSASAPSSASQLVRLKYSQRKSRTDKDAGVLRLILNGLPDFVAAKCGWKYALCSVLFFLFLLLLLQDASYEDSAFARKVAADLKNNLAAADLRRAREDPILREDDGTKKSDAAGAAKPVPLMRPPRDLPPLSTSMEYFVNGHYLAWNGMDTYNEAQEDALMELYMQKRGDWKRKRKSAAVCLAGLLRSGFSNDLQWLHTLYKTVGTYDLFVWHTPDSVPFELGMLHPRIVSFNRWLPPPPGMNKKYRYSPRELEDWAIHLWGYGHCASMVHSHMNATGTEYDYMLISSPNITFTDQLLPSLEDWNTTAVTLMPHQSLTERAIFGPLPLVAQFTPLLFPAIMSWPGNRSPTEYAEFVASTKGVAVHVLRE